MITLKFDGYISCEKQAPMLFSCLITGSTIFNTISAIYVTDTGKTDAITAITL